MVIFKLNLGLPRGYLVLSNKLYIMNMHLCSSIMHSALYVWHNITQLSHGPQNAIAKLSHVMGVPLRMLL